MKSAQNYLSALFAVACLIGLTSSFPVRLKRSLVLGSEERGDYIFGEDDFPKAGFNLWGYSPTLVGQRGVRGYGRKWITIPPLVSPTTKARREAALKRVATAKMGKVAEIPWNNASHIFEKPDNNGTPVVNNVGIQELLIPVDSTKVSNATATSVPKHSRTGLNSPDSFKPFDFVPSEPSSPDLSLTRQPSVENKNVVPEVRRATNFKNGIEVFNDTVEGHLEASTRRPLLTALKQHSTSPTPHWKNGTTTEVYTESPTYNLSAGLHGNVATTAENHSIIMTEVNKLDPVFNETSSGLGGRNTHNPLKPDPALNNPVNSEASQVTKFTVVQDSSLIATNAPMSKLTEVSPDRVDLNTLELPKATPNPPDRIIGSLERHFIPPGNSTDERIQTRNHPFTLKTTHQPYGGLKHHITTELTIREGKEDNGVPQGNVPLKLTTEYSTMTNSVALTNNTPATPKSVRNEPLVLTTTEATSHFNTANLSIANVDQSPNQGNQYTSAHNLSQKQIPASISSLETTRFQSSGQMQTFVTSSPAPSLGRGELERYATAGGTLKTGQHSSIASNPSATNIWFTSTKFPLSSDHENTNKHTVLTLDPLEKGDKGTFIDTTQKPNFQRRPATLSSSSPSVTQGKHEHLLETNSITPTSTTKPHASTIASSSNGLLVTRKPSGPSETTAEPQLSGRDHPKRIQSPSHLLLTITSINSGEPRNLKPSTNKDKSNLTDKTYVTSFAPLTTVQPVKTASGQYYVHKFPTHTLGAGTYTVHDKSPMPSPTRQGSVGHTHTADALEAVENATSTSNQQGTWGGPQFPRTATSSTFHSPADHRLVANGSVHNTKTTEANKNDPATSSNSLLNRTPPHSPNQNNDVTEVPTVGNDVHKWMPSTNRSTGIRDTQIIEESQTAKSSEGSLVLQTRMTEKVTVTSLPATLHTRDDSYSNAGGLASRRNSSTPFIHNLSSDSSYDTTSRRTLLSVTFNSTMTKSQMNKGVTADVPFPILKSSESTTKVGSGTIAGHPTETSVAVQNDKMDSSIPSTATPMRSEGKVTLQASVHPSPAASATVTPTDSGVGTLEGRGANKTGKSNGEMTPTSVPIRKTPTSWLDSAHRPFISEPDGETRSSHSAVSGPGHRVSTNAPLHKLMDSRTTLSFPSTHRKDNHLGETSGSGDESKQHVVNQFVLLNSTLASTPSSLLLDSEPPSFASQSHDRIAKSSEGSGLGITTRSPINPLQEAQTLAASPLSATNVTRIQLSIASGVDQSVIVFNALGSTTARPFNVMKHLVAHHSLASEEKAVWGSSRKSHVQQSSSTTTRTLHSVSSNEVASNPNATAQKNDIPGEAPSGDSTRSNMRSATTKTVPSKRAATTQSSSIAGDRTDFKIPPVGKSSEMITSSMRLISERKFQEHSEITPNELNKDRNTTKFDDTVSKPNPTPTPGSNLPHSIETPLSKTTALPDFKHDDGIRNNKPLATSIPTFENRHNGRSISRHSSPSSADPSSTTIPTQNVVHAGQNSPSNTNIVAPAELSGLTMIGTSSSAQNPYRLPAESHANLLEDSTHDPAGGSSAWTVGRGKVAAQAWHSGGDENAGSREEEEKEEINADTIRMEADGEARRAEATVQQTQLFGVLSFNPEAGKPGDDDDDGPANIYSRIPGAETSRRNDSNPSFDVSQEIVPQTTDDDDGKLSNPYAVKHYLRGSIVLPLEDVV